jgi:DNA-binding transcriptional MerR regulator/methylmalonyl-CoA mutase cobalamin-binding subunit
MEALHPIRIVARRTGLSAHLIRMWERRYNAVIPERTDSGRRVYSDADIERLRLLKKAVAQGEAISQVSRLSNQELLDLLRGAAGVSQATKTTSPRTENPARTDEFIQRAQEAVNSFDIGALESTLLDAEIRLSRPALLEQFLAPLLRKIGEKWQQGEVRIAQEHLATAAIRSFLGRLLAAHTFHPSSSWIVVGTPVGQLHELGAYLAALTAASCGWNIAYLGSDLPAEEIAVALRRYDALAVCLSVVYPSDDPRLLLELRRLRQFVGDEAHIIVGGQGAVSYQSQLNELGIIVTTDLSKFGLEIDRLRRSRMKASSDAGN